MDGVLGRLSRDDMRHALAYIRTPDGMNLRVARYEPRATSAQGAAGTVVVCLGFAQSIEKYAEVVDELRARHFHVVVFEWRGQGLSGRMMGDPSKGHIDDFSLYERDVKAVEAQVLQPFCPRPWFALAHSMGASIVLAQAAHHASPFDRLVVCAPMISLKAVPQHGLMRMAIECADLIGLGSMAAPVSARQRRLIDVFDGNGLTSDADHFARWQKQRAELGPHDLRAPTIGWMHAALRCMDDFANPECPRHILMPTLVFSAGADVIVERRAVERFAARLKAGRCITLPCARHEILHESAPIRALFWAGFDAFIPGTSAPEGRVTH